MPKLTNFSVKKAHEIQVCLSKKIIREDRLPEKLETVGGVDVSYVDNAGIGAVVVLDYESLQLLEAQVAVRQVKMPYVPTLLSFREIPSAVSAIQRLKIQPDVFLVDAQGLAHPYRCGFASHLGLVIGKPTVGAAKSRLIGTPVEKGGRTFLVDNSEVIGEAVTTKQGAKPVYVSVGHMVSLETSVRIVKHCAKNRIPEPLIQAHKLATQQRIQLASESKVNI
ncbi:MAG: endonuclease V [Candidatus Bathyarchaeota archaeon]|nr:endonuclease V [Candidatus Bathyarchaeota archaeon]